MIVLILFLWKEMYILFLLVQLIRKIPDITLPSVRQALSRVLFLIRTEDKTCLACINIVMDEVISIWQRTQIPVKRKDNIIIF